MEFTVMVVERIVSDTW